MDSQLRRRMALVDAGQGDEIEAWARPHAEAGDADAQFLLGYLVFRSGDVDSRSACAWLRRAAELGSARAQRDLACCLAVGEDGFLADQAEARLWYGRAAAAGHCDAQYNVGLMCLLGEGGPALPEEAVAWLERAAGGDASDPAVEWAVETLVDLYERGERGVLANPERASALRARLEELRRQSRG